MDEAFRAGDYLLRTGDLGLSIQLPFLVERCISTCRCGPGELQRLWDMLYDLECRGLCLAGSTRMIAQRLATKHNADRTAHDINRMHLGMYSGMQCKTCGLRFQGQDALLAHLSVHEWKPQPISRGWYDAWMIAD